MSPALVRVLLLAGVIAGTAFCVWALGRADQEARVYSNSSGAWRLILVALGGCFVAAAAGVFLVGGVS